MSTPPTKLMYKIASQDPISMKMKAGSNNSAGIIGCLRRSRRAVRVLDYYELTHVLSTFDGSCMTYGRCSDNQPTGSNRHPFAEKCSSVVVPVIKEGTGAVSENFYAMSLIRIGKGTESAKHKLDQSINPELQVYLKSPTV
ncbi:hypothetical protein BDV11DRAFT_152336 [Aspergillus similis]